MSPSRKVLVDAVAHFIHDNLENCDLSDDMMHAIEECLDESGQRNGEDGFGHSVILTNYDSIVLKFQSGDSVFEVKIAVGVE